MLNKTLMDGACVYICFMFQGSEAAFNKPLIKCISGLLKAASLP